ncbi:MAG TPA: SOS response-associated peptidase [Bacteroidales bacterium]|jgi:putative SOS response-associated peptidase YedK|nr:SOS response-associated peptidase [Bacteroidales bacterium]
MCYTVKIDLTREELERRFGAKLRDSGSYTTGTRVNAFSLPQLPVICNDNPAEIRILTWGLIPYWVLDSRNANEIRMKTFNARCESLAVKASYRNILGRNRCLVLVNGFYEWQTKEKNKIPYYIGLNGESAIALAGLYDKWVDPATGEILDTFTIVTTKANPMLEVIHNLKKRMPVILSDEDQRKWLDIKSDPSICGLFEPYPEEKMFSEMLS